MDWVANVCEDNLRRSSGYNDVTRGKMIGDMKGRKAG